MRLDYKLKTDEERLDYVNSYLDKHNSKVRPADLEKLADYLLFAGENITIRERSEESPIITKNREVTLNARETSLESTIDNLPGGEDTLWTVASSPEYPLTVKEPLDMSKISEIPNGESKLRAIKGLEKSLEKAAGRHKFKLKKAIIESWQDIYNARVSMNAAAGYPTTPKLAPTLKGAAQLELPETKWLDSEDMPQSDSDFSLFEPTTVLILLRHYFNLKSEVRENLHCDMHYFLWELETNTRMALAHYPVLLDLCRLEMLGYTGAEIVNYMEQYHGIIHSEQYFSTLWTKKIPKLVSQEAKKSFIKYYYRNHRKYGFKTCSCCKKRLPAHPLFYHRNTSNDGYYSKCKDCRKQTVTSFDKYSQDPFTGQIVETSLLSIGYAPESGDIYG